MNRNDETVEQTPAIIKDANGAICDSNNPLYLHPSSTPWMTLMNTSFDKKVTGDDVDLCLYHS